MKIGQRCRQEYSVRFFSATLYTVSANCAPGAKSDRPIYNWHYRRLCSCGRAENATTLSSWQRQDAGPWWECVIVINSSSYHRM